MSEIKFIHLKVTEQQYTEIQQGLTKLYNHRSSSLKAYYNKIGKTYNQISQDPPKITITGIEKNGSFLEFIG